LIDAAAAGGAPGVIERRAREVASLKRALGRLEAALIDLDSQLLLFADV
jgi:hypothetical protein